MKSFHPQIKTSQNQMSLTNRKSKKLSLLLFIFIIFIIYFQAYFEKAKRKNEIITDFQIGSAEIHSSGFVYMRGSEVRFSFKSNKKVIKGREVSHKYDKIYKQLIGKSFPVVFKKSDPNYNDLLIFPKDFKEYKLSFPDSLIWVKQY